MHRRTLAIVGALLLAAACRDGPTTPPSSPDLAATGSIEGRADGMPRLGDVLEDPLILDLMGRPEARSLRGTYQGLLASAAARDVLAVSEALSAARRALPSPAVVDDPDAAVLRDVLDLHLEGAAALVGPAPSEPVARHARPVPTPHDGGDQ